MKILNFKYCGGIDTVKVSSSNWSVYIPDPCKWFTVEQTPTSVIFNVKENASYEDRNCIVSITNGTATKEIEVKQEGYRNLLVDIQDTVIIPYSYYEDNDTYDIEVRIYGGSGKCEVSDGLGEKLEKVFDGSDLFEDYILHITQDDSGIFTFAHVDKDAYIKYCEDNNIKYYEEDLTKVIRINQVSKEMMDGVVSFTYNGKEYINGLPPRVAVTGSNVSTIIINYGGYFNKDMEYIKNTGYDVHVSSNWVMAKYDSDNKKIYLKASSKNLFSDRYCMLTVRSGKQIFKSLVCQRQNS